MMFSPFLSKIVSASSAVHCYAYRRRRQKKQLSAPELSAAKSVCMKKTGLARLGFIREFSIVRERRHVTPCLSSVPLSTYRLMAIIKLNNNNNNTGYCERLWTSQLMHYMYTFAIHTVYLCDDCSQYGLQSNMLLPKYRSGNPLSSNVHDFLK